MNQSRPNPVRKASDPARKAALDLLIAVSKRDAYANLVLPELLRSRGISGRDAALATELAYGTSRVRGLLDAVLARCVDRELSTVDTDVLDALRLGSYQLLRTRIPPHAAVASTVDLVRASRGRGPAGFVNAVLRKVAERDEPSWIVELAPDEHTDPIGRLAFRHAHPRWIAQAFADALGGDGRADRGERGDRGGSGDRAEGSERGDGGELARALAADNEAPAVHLAARPGVITVDELAALTGGEPGPFSPYGVRLLGGDPADLDVVTEHLAMVQDEGSQLVALALANAPLNGPDTGRWLDLCAGPGGKAALLGALVGLDGGTLDAVERAEHRADLVRKACADLPVRVHVADGRDSGLPVASFDRVLVDVPCTGLGALRRRPEARWRRTPEDLDGLTALQAQLLTAALRLVRPGGVVGYVTCSPHPAETVDVVRAAVTGSILGDQADAIQLDARPLLPGVPDLGGGPHVQLWPHRHGTDAMFCALLRRP